MRLHFLAASALFTLYACTPSTVIKETDNSITKNTYDFSALEVGQRYGLMTVAEISRRDSPDEGTVTFSGSLELDVKYIYETHPSDMLPSGVVCVLPKDDIHWNHWIPMPKQGQYFFCLQGDVHPFPIDSAGSAKIRITSLTRYHVGMETYDKATLADVVSVEPAKVNNESLLKTFEEIIY